MYQIRWLRWLERKNDVLAFGVETSTCKYRLSLSKYAGMADCIRLEAQNKDRAINVLDVGCDGGRLIRWCSGQRIEFVGVDVSPQKLAEAKKAGYLQTELCNLALGTLPFKDETFDVVVCSHVLEHLEHPARVAAEARRILRTGGILIVGVPMHTWWTRLIRIHVLPIFMPSKRRAKLVAEFGHVQFFTLPTLKALCSDGLEVEDARGFYLLSAGRYMPFENWRWYYRLNSWWGTTFPNLTNEVNIVARKSKGA